MSRTRREVIARDSFTVTGTESVRHPAVMQTDATAGVVRQGTRLWSDDAIVRAHPTFFVDADMLPGAADQPRPRSGGPPTGLGLDIDMIRAALREYVEGPWPPPQPELLPYSARRIRQVLQEANTDWETEVKAAESER